MNIPKHDQRTRRKSPDYDTLQCWLDAFLIDRKSQGLAQGTLQFYHAKLELFTEYAIRHEINRVSELTPTYIRDFMIELSMTHNPGGVHAAFRCLRAFLRWYELEADPYDWTNPIKNVKPPKLSVLPLEPVDLKVVGKLLKTCDPTIFHGARDYAIFLTLLDTGVRASELCNLNIEDVDAIQGDVLIRNGKGGKPRMVIVGKHTRKALRSYLRLRVDDNDAMFVTDDGNRLPYFALNLILRRRSKQANVVKPELHDFRRAFALNSLRNGIDVYSLQRLMGHAGLTVLQRYLAQTNDDIRTAHAKASPVDNWKF